MRFDSREDREYRQCPDSVTEALRDAGGDNRFGDPLFRMVWGWNRVITLNGQWEDWEQGVATLTDRKTGFSMSQPYNKLRSSVIETRHVPKYLPGNSWHLEMWRPPEDYGSPDQWGKLGEEVIGIMTLDTAGPYPYQGEYELCYPITSDFTSSGYPVPLVGIIVVEICQMIRSGKEKFSYLQRRAAIEQEMARKEDGFVRRAEDILRDGLPSFHGNSFVVKGGNGNA